MLPDEAMGCEPGRASLPRNTESVRGWLRTPTARDREARSGLVLDPERKRAGAWTAFRNPVLAKGGAIMRVWNVIGYYSDAEPGDPAGHYIGNVEASDPEAAIRGCYLDCAGPLVVICAIDETGNIYEPPIG